MIKKFLVTITGINKSPSHHEYKPEVGDLAVGLQMNVQYPEDNKSFDFEPILVLRGSLLFNYAAQINDLALKAKLTEKTLDAIFVPEDKLAYQEFQFKPGEEINFNGYQIKFANFDKDPVHHAYTRQEKDITVGALMEITDSNNKQFAAQPIYLIRGNKPYVIKDEVESEGLHFQFVKIDPTTGTSTINIAQYKSEKQIPFVMAANSFRNDYIVLEAVVFPGINFFWLGTCMMMLGLFIGMFRSIREKIT